MPFAFNDDRSIYSLDNIVIFEGTKTLSANSGGYKTIEYQDLINKDIDDILKYAVISASLSRYDSEWHTHPTRDGNNISNGISVSLVNSSTNNQHIVIEMTNKYDTETTFKYRIVLLRIID